MDLWMGLYLVSLLNMVCCLPESSYTIHLDKRSFEDAQNYCTPGSFLTDIPNENEIAKILKAISDKNNKTATLFWIGLKKNKGNCMMQNLPLKGFYWMVDNSTQSNGIKWKTTPTDTCTDVRCGLLSVEYEDNSAKSSGAMDAACKNNYPFICKRNVKVTCSRPDILGIHNIIENTTEPFARQVICSSNHKFNLECSNDLVWTVVGYPNMDVSQLCLQCKEGLKKDSSGNCVDIDECETTNPCKYRCINTAGSYKCVCPDNDNDSDACNESMVSTTDPKNSNADEGKSEPTILPDYTSTHKTIGHTEENTGSTSYIIVPVIIALLIFMVLLVIIAAVIKCCLRRRTIKLARRKAEAVALNGSSSMEKVNEKEET
ncbi:complement component C1q receptor-like [Xyrauchen texanus]|uniref:complement component C1q receptor-like n=1 Tax=Xyrauchen texanus TaxID=154827 RepID=UPI002241EC2E|nr:complement component C1q receptor-like [Xyrauchen texanus]